MKKQLFLVFSTLVLTGCAITLQTQYAELPKNFHSPKATTQEKIKGVVCIVDDATVNLALTRGITRYVYNIDNVRYGLQAELKKFFSDVVVTQAKERRCTLTLEPYYHLSVNATTGQYESIIQFALQSKLNQSIAWFDVRSRGVKDLTKISIESLMERYAKEGFHDALNKLGKKLESSSMQKDLRLHASLAYNLSNSSFVRQIKSPTKIVENKALGIDRFTDTFFEQRALQYFQAQRIKALNTDGPTQIAKYEKNSKYRISNQGKYRVLNFSNATARRYELDGNLARIIYKAPNAKGRDYILVEGYSKAATKVLENHEPGQPLLVRYQVGEKGPYVLWDDWVEKEVQKLKRVTITYLSGVTDPKDKESLQTWQLAKSILAQALLTEKLSTFQSCRETSNIEACLNPKNAKALQTKFAATEMNQQIKDLDQKIKSLQK